MKAFDDIPGTTVFTPARSRAGYDLNQFCMGLMRAENRAAFLADEAKYLDATGMSDAQKAAVRARDYNAMIALGGNIYFLAKIGATDGRSFQQLAASMGDGTQEDYAAMMAAGGRAPEWGR